MGSNGTAVVFEEEWMEKFYAPVDDLENIIVGIVLMFLIILGVVGNSTCIYIFSTLE